jgi:hypothetical protein
MLLPSVLKERGPGPLVHVIRDPVAMAISAYRQFGPHGRGGNGMEGKLAHWYKTHTHILRWVKHWPRPTLTVRIEDLWAMGEHGLDPLAEFFGLEPNEKLREMAARREGGATAEVEIPDYEIPPEVTWLASAFGYEGYEYEPPLPMGHSHMDKGDAIKYRNFGDLFVSPPPPQDMV